MRAGAESPQLVEQRVRQHEIGHVVDREGRLQAFGSDAPVGENGAGVVDQHIDARLARRDLGADPLRLGHQREIGRIRAMPTPGAIASSVAQRCLGAACVASHEHDARAHFRQRLRRDGANARRDAGRHDRLALHRETSPTLRGRRDMITGDRDASTAMGASRPRPGWAGSHIARPMDSKSRAAYREQAKPELIAPVAPPSAEFELVEQGRDRRLARSSQSTSRPERTKSRAHVDLIRLARANDCPAR